MADALSFEDFTNQKPPDVPIAGLPTEQSFEEFSKPQKIETTAAIAGPTLGDKAAKLPALFSQGAMSEGLGLIGAIPDLAAAGIRATGLPAPPSGFYSEGLKSGYDKLAAALSPYAPGPKVPVNDQGQMVPQGALENFAEGGGKGLAQAASIFVPATIASNLSKAGTVTDAVTAALKSQPAMQALSGIAGGGTTQSTGNPWLGTLAAFTTPLVPWMAGHLISPVTSTLNAEQQRLVNVAAQEGIPLTAGQQTGSRPMQAVESVLADLPPSAGSAAAESEIQREAFNKAVLSRAGIQATAATPDVLQAAKQGMSGEFENLAAKTTVNLDAPFLSDLQDAATRYGSKLPSQTKGVFDAYVNDILNTGNQMPGQTYQVTRSDLSRQAKSLTNSDPALSTALRSVRDALDDAAERSMPPNMKDVWNDLRERYGNLKTIAKTMANPSAQSAGGNISPATLWNAARAQNPGQFPMGAGDLNDLARVGQAFIKPQIANSGTPLRTFLTNLLTGGGGGVIGGATAVGALTHPYATAATLGGTFGIPYLAQKFIQSAPGKAYLTNQLATGVTPNISRGLLAAILANQSGQVPSMLKDLGQSLSPGQ